MMFSIKNQIETLRVLLHDRGEILESPKWQSIEAGYDMYELSHLYFKSEMPSTIEGISEQTKADLPWAENHFQERISGIAANPGYEYQNWPYYRKDKDNERFRSEASGEENNYFSHTYMERFWPDKSLVGTGKVEIKLGDYNDVVDRLCLDNKTRQAYLSIWHPQDQTNADQRVPCTLGYWFLIRKNKLDITYLIRSVDFFRHLRNDIYMTVRLAQETVKRINEKTGLNIEVGMLEMWIGNLHCFHNEKFRLKKPIF